MVKLLLKKSGDDAGILVEAAENVMAFPNVVSHLGEAYVREIGGYDSWKACGTCRHLGSGAAVRSGADRVPATVAGFCSVDNKVTHSDYVCRNGGWSPESVVYLRARRLTVVAASDGEAVSLLGSDDSSPPAAAEISGEETTQVAERSYLPTGKSLYTTVALFFAASALGTLWVLQWAAR